MGQYKKLLSFSIIAACILLTINFGFRSSLGLFLKPVSESFGYGREIFETWYKGSMMVQSGLPLEKIITHHYHYTDFQKGFDVMRSGQSGKVILNWEVESKSDYHEF
jgi:hypothetical protein